MNRTLKEIYRVVQGGGEVTLRRGQVPNWLEVKVQTYDPQGNARHGTTRVVDLELVEQYLDPNRDLLGEVVKACYENILGAEKRRPQTGGTPL